MRPHRLAPLLLLPLAVVLLGATCVTRFDRRGDAGPWTGEFVNYNAYRVSEFETAATVRDANGADAGATAFSFCPTSLEPGESGAFEMHLVAPPAGLALPLAAGPPAISAYSGFDFEQPRAALVTGVLSTNVATATAQVQVQNVSANEAFPNGRVCGIARDGAGAIVSVSTPVILPNLDPGALATLTLSFTTLAGVTAVEIHARAASTMITRTNADGSRVFDLGQFVVTLPRGWYYEPLQGIDSFVGRLRSDTGAELFFDYGWYSGDLSGFETNAKYTVLHEEIDRFPARIVYPRFDDIGTVGVSIETEASSSRTMRTSLLMNGENLTLSQRRDALAIFRSIDFSETR